MSINQNVVGAAFAVPGPDRMFELGTRIKGDGGSEWIYVQATGAITGAGYVATYDRTFQAALLSTSNDGAGQQLGVAAAAFADNDYGWVQIWGACDAIQVLASAAANVALNTTATAGALDDDGGATAFVANGIMLTTARAASAGTAPGFLSYPMLAMAAHG